MTKVSALVILSAVLAALAQEVRAEPERMDEHALAATKGGFLDFYMIMPTLVVRQQQIAGGTGAGTLETRQQADVVYQSEINVTSSEGQATMVSETTTNGVVAPPIHQPVWVPWKQELRPLWYFAQAFAETGQ